MLQKQSFINEALLLENRINVLINKFGLTEQEATKFEQKFGKYAMWFANAMDDYIKGIEIEGYKYDEKIVRNMLASMIEENSQFFEQTGRILAWLRFPLTPKQNLKELTYNEALGKMVEHETKLSRNEYGFFNYVEKNEVVKQYPETNGTQFYWAYIPKNKCEEEGTAMNHCGYFSGTNTILYSLRSRKDLKGFEPLTSMSDRHVTLAFDKENNTVVECKGKSNTKPKPEYFPFIFDFIYQHAKLGLFEGIKGGEYEWSDMSDEELKKMYEVYPDVVARNEGAARRLNIKYISGGEPVVTLELKELLEGYTDKYDWSDHFNTLEPETLDMVIYLISEATSLSPKTIGKDWQDFLEDNIDYREYHLEDINQELLDDINQALSQAHDENWVAAAKQLIEDVYGEVLEISEQHVKVKILENSYFYRKMGMFLYECDGDPKCMMKRALRSERVILEMDMDDEYRFNEIAREKLSAIIPGKLLNEVLTPEQIYNKHYKDMEINHIYDEERKFQIFSQIINADPTTVPDEKMGRYSKWLLNLFIHGKLKLEDLYKAKQYLTTFEASKAALKRQGKEIDITKYKSLTDLYRAVEPFIGKEDDYESNSQTIKKIKEEETVKFHEDDKWLVVIPKTERSACLYGKGTQWCTAASKSDNMFDEYAEQGNLFILISKQNPNVKYQLHIESGQFMDVHDSPVSANKIIEPSLMMKMLIHEGVNFRDNWKADGEYIVVKGDALVRCVDSLFSFDQRYFVECIMMDRKHVQVSDITDDGGNNPADFMNFDYEEILNGDNLQRYEAEEINEWETIGEAYVNVEECKKIIRFEVIHYHGLKFKDDQLYVPTDKFILMFSDDDYEKSVFNFTKECIDIERYNEDLSRKAVNESVGEDRIKKLEQIRKYLLGTGVMFHNNGGDIKTVISEVENVGYGYKIVLTPFPGELETTPLNRMTYILENYFNIDYWQQIWFLDNRELGGKLKRLYESVEQTNQKIELLRKYLLGKEILVGGIVHAITIIKIHYDYEEEKFVFRAAISSQSRSKEAKTLKRTIMNVESYFNIPRKIQQWDIVAPSGYVHRNYGNL